MLEKLLEMNQSEEERVCRLCAKSSSKYHELFKSNEARDEELILDKIHHCLPIVITKDNSLPTSICSNCLNHLNISYELRSQTLHTDALLKKQTLQINSNERMRKEVKTDLGKESPSSEGESTLLVIGKSTEYSEEGSKTVDDTCNNKMTNFSDSSKTVGNSNSLKNKKVSDEKGQEYSMDSLLPVKKEQVTNTDDSTDYSTVSEETNVGAMNDNGGLGNCPISVKEEQAYTTDVNEHSVKCSTPLKKKKRLAAESAGLSPRSKQADPNKRPRYSPIRAPSPSYPTGKLRSRSFRSKDARYAPYWLDRRDKAKLICQSCGEKFTTPDDLTRHEIKQHCRDARSILNRDGKANCKNVPNQLTAKYSSIKEDANNNSPISAEIWVGSDGDMSYNNTSRKNKRKKKKNANYKTMYDGKIFNESNKKNVESIRERARRSFAVDIQKQCRRLCEEFNSHLQSENDRHYCRKKYYQPRSIFCLICFALLPSKYDYKLHLKNDHKMSASRHGFSTKHCEHCEALIFLRDDTEKRVKRLLASLDENRNKFNPHIDNRKWESNPPKRRRSWSSSSG